MDREKKQGHESSADDSRLSRRQFLDTSGKFLIYTSPVLTTLLTADKALAVSEDPYFVVEARTELQGTFAGMPAKGTSGAASTATWTMQPALNGTARVSYAQYYIGIEGSGKYMPTQTIQVMITWARATADTSRFEWGPGSVLGDTTTVNVPVGGGTLGVGGTILDSVESPWPWIDVDVEYPGGPVGTVTFDPVGTGIGRLKKLTLNIVV
jgi:hypothetical protein